MPEDLEHEIEREIATGSDPDHPLRRWLRRRRAWVQRHPAVLWSYRILVGILGVTVVIVGLILVPLPGPGWLIVFLGVSILGTEFHAARRFNAFLKRTLKRFWAWWRARRVARADREAA